MKWGIATIEGHDYLMAQDTHGWYRVDRLMGAFGVAQEPWSARTLLDRGEQAVDQLRDWLVRAYGAGMEPDPEPTQWQPPVHRPQKILCVGLNYRPHVEESAMAIPEYPVWFNKFPNALVGSGTAVCPPADVHQLDYEAELVVVIGRRCYRCGEDEALRYVAGYCNGNDISARDLQFRTSQWLLGKAADGFGPLGPYVVTADTIDPGQLTIVGRRNGEIVQQASTSSMIFSVPYLISYISRYLTLEPGDLIFSGTPEGVIFGQPENRRQWLQPGEVVSVAIDGLGELVTPIGSHGSDA
ncbi:MAG: fumarylacetoacetate hydrolase family protein [Sulfobacillus sp.]|nr:fumarylacetoacetate hydrolase family protein [Sulfobacillus sp.]